MRVICAGEMLVDIFVRPVQQIPFENDTQIVPDIRITSGGDANNNAINFAKLGHQVAYLGRLGCDEMGDYVASLAQAAGIDISHTVRSSTARKTKSVILVNPKGDRTFLPDPGTSAEFCFDDCDLSLLDWAEMLQIGGAFHLPKFDGEGSAQLLKAAKERGVITSMDVTSDRSGRWKGILDPCWPYLDYFLPSIEQASQIAGTEDPRAIADFFLDRGVKNVAVKLGSRGSYFKNRQTAFFAGIYQGLSIVETTGAGDAFCAGFLTGVGENLPPEDCITLGSACSALAIQAVGATAGMGSRATVNDFIHSHQPLDFRSDIS